ncbi:hypothetical protein [Bacteroides ovatus]|uniref:hypothetical protein n=1 Tax=Bacteroides ovatus TaxID=28116 RepID=UPI0002EADEE9|nr:hypothetical protein [Bacteroides ovatus]
MEMGTRETGRNGYRKGRSRRITGQSESPMETRFGKDDPAPNQKKMLSLRQII